jgi:hypothetical protein
MPTATLLIGMHTLDGVVSGTLYTNDLFPQDILSAWVSSLVWQLTFTVSLVRFSCTSLTKKLGLGDSLTSVNGVK